MGSFGSISAMVTSIKNNLASKSNRKTMRDRNGDYRARIGKALKFKDKMTIEQHQEHRNKLRFERIRSNVILYLLIIFSAVVVFFVVSYI